MGQGGAWVGLPPVQAAIPECPCWLSLSVRLLTTALFLPPLLLQEKLILGIGLGIGLGCTALVLIALAVFATLVRGAAAQSNVAVTMAKTP